MPVMEMVKVVRIDPVLFRNSIEQIGIVKYWNYLGMPPQLFTGLYVDGAHKGESNAVLKPKGHVETGAGRRACIRLHVQACD